MPITQERQFAILSAGLDYKQSLERLIQSIQKAWAIAYAAADNPAIAFTELSQLSAIAAEANLLNYPTSSGNNLILEAAHIQRTAKRNVRVAEHKRARRRAAGIPERQAVPPVQFSFGTPSLEPALRLIREIAQVRRPQPTTQTAPTDDDILAFLQGISQEQRVKWKKDGNYIPASAMYLFSPELKDLAESAEGEDEFADQPLQGEIAK